MTADNPAIAPQTDAPTDAPADDLLAKIRAQFDRAPYPRIPLDTLPPPSKLYYHSVQTAFYRRDQRVVDPAGMAILDVGCGSGFGTMALAIANPGATVVGADLSPASVDLAQKRLGHHGLGDRAEFVTLSLEELAQLGRQFDYINCDELLYLQPDPAASLAAMGAVLKPHGIIRANLHSRHQRSEYFKAQQIASMLGLLDDNPGEFEVEAFSDLFDALRDDCRLKARTWNKDNRQQEEKMMMNFLFQGDRGFTVPDLFEMLGGAGLEFVSMTNWQGWNLLELFKDQEELPAFLAMGLEMAEEADKLALYELLHFEHRLIDFWCSHPDAGDRAWTPVEEWEPEDWEATVVHLHPQLQTDEFRQALEAAVLDGKNLNMNDHLSLPWGLATVSSAMAGLLAPLFSGSKSFEEMVAAGRRSRPVDPVTLDPMGPDQAMAPLRYLLREFVKAGYVFVEPMA